LPRTRMILLPMLDGAYPDKMNAGGF
jgi:hypothetical protein